MKTIKLQPVVVALLLALPLNALPQKTEIIWLSGTDAAHTVNWKFFCTEGQNSGKWTTIPVPSNWELQGFGNYNYGHDWKDKNIKLGKEHGLYQFEFNAPADWKGKTVNLVFDGSMTDTEVKINGKPAGKIHQGAFYRFRYDITKLLKFDQTNLLEADVAKHSANESVNRAERQCDFWIFGGIYRPVFLEILPEIHITRAAIDAKADGSFNALITLSGSKENYSIVVELSDLNGKKPDGRFEAGIMKGEISRVVSGRFEHIKAWNPEWPHLYTLRISLKNKNGTIHEIDRRIGFRTVELRRHDGFYVNGEKVVFKGVNRHSFWPETGRCLSRENHLTDLRLIKEMNMNAVRMSHYVPDEQFLDLCDSLGLFVLDEVTGWQQSYDTVIGPDLIREAILKDENHPCVVAWDHGNEGGWNFASEKPFHELDVQQRPVFYPWLLRNGMDTHHYPVYDYATGRFVHGNDPFMPTEMLHGLYDGGSGAGLEEYWRFYQSSPLLTGGFLWVLADEAVLRTDMKGKVFDSSGNRAPDGILGPHREKEGSFYTIKEIWSPVQPSPVIINRSWNGKLFLKNSYIYTDLNSCSFTWKTIKTGFGNRNDITTGSGAFPGPDCLPGETAMVKINPGQALQDADLFLFTAYDPGGREIYTWSWPLIQPDDKVPELLSLIAGKESEIAVTDEKTAVTVVAGEMTYSFSKTDGTLLSVQNSRGKVSFSGGPVPAGCKSDITSVVWKKDSGDNFILDVTTSNFPGKMTWTVFRTGLLYLETSPVMKNMRDIDFLGISFNYPEEKCKGIKWMGKGPYRVWKNRLKGNNTGVWQKEYNNTITGESFEKLIYPEFKGYHANLFWATVETTESPVTIICGTPNLYFRLYTPAKPLNVAGGTYPPFPEGDISFLYEIPAIGSKFNQPEDAGPSGRKGVYSGHPGDEGYPIRLWFDFGTR